MATTSDNKNGIKFVAIALAAVSPLAAKGATFEIAEYAGVATSDNISRTYLAEQRDTILNVGTQFAAQDNTSRLSYDLAGDLQFLDYTRNTNSSQVVGAVLGRGLIRLIPEALEWELDENFGQTQRSIYSVESPENRENINYLSTGPNISLPLGAATLFRAKARYSRLDYQTSPFDNQRYSALLEVEHELSEQTSISLSGDQERIDPQQSSIFAGYDRQELYASYTIKGVRTQAAVDVGANRVNPDGAAQTSGLFRVHLSRKFAANSDVTVDAGRQLTDIAQQLQVAGGGLSLPNPETQDLSTSLTPFRTEYIRSAVNLVGQKTLLRFAVGYNKETFPAGQTSFNREYATSAVSASRNIGPHLRVNLGFSYEDYKFEYLPTNDYHQYDAQAGLGWQIGSMLSLSLTGGRYFSNDAPKPYSITENRFALQVHYGRPISRPMAPLLHL